MKHSIGYSSAAAGRFTTPSWFYRLVICAVTACLLRPVAAHALDDAALFDLSLDQLNRVDINSGLPSAPAQSLREPPGIASVVTQQQIQESGARDLSEILMQVPGFSLDSDVESLVGLTYRGLPGQDGKVLLVVDGLEINEPLYGSLPILNHIPAEMIQQVEVVHGPGPVADGDSAGLAVIRVTTKGADQNGGYGIVTPAYTEGRFSENYSAGLGFTTNAWRFSGNVSYSDTFIANQPYTSLNGGTVDLTHRSDMKPVFVDLDAAWHDLDLRVIYDAYNYDDTIYYGEPPPNPVNTKFDSVLASLKYEAHPTDWLKFTPELTYRHQLPWNVHSDDLGNFNIKADRYQADLAATAELSDNSSVTVGMRYFHDTATAVDTSDAGEAAAVYYNGQPSVGYDDIAGFAQYDLNTRWANLSVGGRYEYYTPVEGHFVPRISLVKAWKKFHLTAQYDQASRIPGINEISDASANGVNLAAEATDHYEVEAGYRFTDSLSWTGNLFYLQVNHPIIYTFTSTGDSYYNGAKLSTAGLESELRWNQPKYSASLGYSFYRAIDNSIASVEGDDARFLAAPTHKITVSGTWHVNPSLDCNFNGYWLSETLAYAYPAAGVTGLPADFVLNAFVNYKFKRFSTGIGVANLLDEKLYAPQPYAGVSGPMPLMGRQIFVRLAFNF